MAKWTALHYDVSKTLMAEKLQHVKIEGLNLYLVIDLPDPVFKRLERDPVWIQKMTDKANAKVTPIIARLVARVKQADQKAARFDPKAAHLFSMDIDTTARHEMEQAGHDMAAEVDRLFEDYKKGQDGLRDFRIKSGAKITMNGVAIVGAVAVTAATHGALAPAGIVAIARSGIVITQECAKLATTADQIARYIQGELKLLGEFMSKNMKDASTMKKVKQSGKEIGLGVLSGLLGVEIPNLKNCKGHIEVHKVDIAKLDHESHELAKTIHGAYDEQVRWEAKVDKAKAELLPKKLEKAQSGAKAAAKILHNLLEATVKVNQGVERANARQIVFEKALNAMATGVPDWVGYVQTAVTLGVDVGLAVGGASTAIEQGLAALIAVEIDVGSELLDRA